MIFYFILFLVLLFAVVYIVERFRQKRNARKGMEEEAPFDTVSEQPASDFTCCGKHDTCEMHAKEDNFLPSIEYYDDEELDAFAGRPGDNYTEEEQTVFQEILDTMRPEDVEGWLFSLRLREINLPLSVAKEAERKKK